MKRRASLANPEACATKGAVGACATTGAPDVSGRSRFAILIGLGNPVCGDDAVGLRVAEQVDRLLAERPVAGVRVATSTRGGFELLDLLTGADAAIVVDCLAVPDARPGVLRHLRPNDLAGSARLVGSHDVGLGDVLELGRMLGVAMPARLEVVGVEARLTGRVEEGLSPAVARAVEPLARDIYRRLAVAVRPMASSRACSPAARRRSGRRGIPPSPAP